MRILLIHQNFPGQFRQLAPYLESLGHELIAICSHERQVALLGKVIRYKEPSKAEGVSLGTSLWHEGLERATLVAKICSELDSQGWIPDRILAHTGWGETLGIKEVWPSVPQILWPELWILPLHGGYGVDPLKTEAELDMKLEQLGRNSLTSVALQSATSWILPTRHQANSLPKIFQSSKLNVIHEGIDTELAKPNDQVKYIIRDIPIDKSVPTITFVNRNLERLRGFDVFMRALPIIQGISKEVRVLIVGDSEVGYGGMHPSGRPLREVMLEELSGKLDLERIHFLGRVPHPILIAILQASWVHVYLSYPFVMGWSLLEAMACGCSIVASKGMPVEEVITNGIEGLLVSINSPEELANAVGNLLANNVLRQSISYNARSRAMNYDHKLVLPKTVKIIEEL